MTDTDGRDAAGPTEDERAAHAYVERTYGTRLPVGPGTDPTIAAFLAGAAHGRAAIMAAIREAVLEERTACAKVAEGCWPPDDSTGGAFMWLALTKAAEHIRARG